MKRLIACTAALVALAASLPVAAQFQKPEDAIKYRQSAFTLMGTHFGRIGAMVQGRTPWDAKAAAENMAVIDAVHKLPFSAFVEGSDKGNTKALPEVWTKQAAFKEAAGKAVAEIAKLDAAVKTGSLDNVKAAFGGVGGTCKGCHDDFRAK